MLLSEPALYRYFDSKRDLFIASLGSAGGRLVELWQQMAAEVDDPLEILRSIALGYYDHARSRSGFMRLQFRALAESDNPDIKEALRSNFRALIRFLMDALDEGEAARPGLHGGGLGDHSLGVPQPRPVPGHHLPAGI